MINQNLLLAGDDGYNLTKSLRFRSSASAYLNRTFGTPTNAKKWTYSLWVKGSPWANAKLLSVCLSGSSEAQINFTGGQLQINSYNGAGTDYGIRTDAVYRDPSSWYHLVFVYDTDNATSTNRAIIYVNGVRQSVTAPNNGMFPSGYSHLFNTNGAVTYIGARPTFLDGFFDGYIAETNFIDGQALTPSSFGSTNALTGVWQPAKYTGTYGTNGFYLPFTNTTSTTTIGYDFSGNSNNWTSNNISLTAGSTYDSMNDVPTMTALASNYATLNPLWKLGSSGYIVPTNGNLKASSPGNNIISSTIPIPSTGKWYMEFTLTSAQYPEYGLASSTATGGGSTSTLFAAYNNGTNYYLYSGNYGTTDTNQAYQSGDVGLIAVDVDNNKLWLGRSRSGTVVWMGGGNPSSGTSPSFSGSGGGGVYATVFDAQVFNNPFVGSGGGGDVWDVNFGQQSWVATPPTGFVALNTFNLPTSTIVKGNTVMDATLWTGNGTSSQVITNGGSFKPDLVWMKTRNQAYGHLLFDSIRGTSLYLQSNSTGADVTDTAMLSSFNSSGFTVGSSGFTNGSGNTEVGWQWQAGQGSTSSNTSGSITSTVSVNASAGFSVVTYTGNGSAGATVGHGLGVAPALIIAKKRSSNGSWQVYSNAISNMTVGYITLNGGSGFDTGTSTIWNNTAPTSSVFTLGTDTDANANGATTVAYCWAEVAGYSKSLAWTGNGSTDGVFINCGFSPAFILIKRTNATTDWVLIDNKRLGYNATDVALNPNASYAENSGYATDFTSNGFKLRTTTGYMNASGGTYIGFAFAQNPFKYSLAR